MKRAPFIALVLALACALLAAPAGASNQQELGRPGGGFPFPPPDCPENCQAVAQVTGFQVQLGDAHNPLRARRSGYVTSFTIRLSKPSAEQVDFFKGTYGDTPEVRLSLVRSLHHAHEYKLLKQTQAFKVEKYFGSSPTFALRQAFRVQKDDIVAITVPTWLPAFAHNLSSDQAWRSSHSEDECTQSSPPSAAQEEEGTKKDYSCFYRTARLLYSATFIGDPKPTNVASRR
jgi:hypothetical protein